MCSFIPKPMYVYWHRRSKMVTGIQMQPPWALWLRELAEMLEPCLVEVKHQGELKLALWTPSPWKTSPCHNTLKEQVGHHPHTTACAIATIAPAAGSKRDWETFSIPNRWEPSIMQYPSATPGINQYKTPGQTDTPTKKKWNWKCTVEGAGVSESAPEKGEGSRSRTCVNYQ
jgi:hypothetical protein